MGGRGASERGPDISVAPGLIQVVVARGSLEERFVTARLEEGQSTESLLERAAAAVKASGGGIVAVDVFGIPGSEAMLRQAFGAIEWPLTWILGKPDLPVTNGGIQIWLLKGAPVESVGIEGRVVGSAWTDGHASYCRLGGLRPASVEAEPAVQAAETLGIAEKTLAAAGMRLGDVVRTWFYLDGILNWYGDFNRTRDDYFRPRGVFDGLVPASTGMGGGNLAGAALDEGVLALRQAEEGALEVRAVASPLQGPALDYGSSFSRAVEAELPDHRRLYVSGTASIDLEGNTVLLDDTAGQIDHTMNVVQAILESRGMGWEDVTRAVAYFKSIEDGLSIFQRDLEKRGVQTLPHVSICNDVCRDDLLFEIEVDAMRAVAGAPQKQGAA
jgi:enamine deaminase RidA (YjgF/YER057c/UK114 family)